MTENEKKAFDDALKEGSRVAEIVSKKLFGISNADWKNGFTNAYARKATGKGLNAIEHAKDLSPMANKDKWREGYNYAIAFNEDVKNPFFGLEKIDGGSDLVKPSSGHWERAAKDSIEKIKSFLNEKARPETALQLFAEGIDHGRKDYPNASKEVIEAYAYGYCYAKLKEIPDIRGLIAEKKVGDIKLEG